jgi:hypothetical protein
MAVLTSSRGLIVLPSELTIPDGGLSVADNVVIDADNVIEQRRGFGEFGSATTGDAMHKQLLTYKGRVLRHYANKIDFDSTGQGAFLTFSGNYVETILGLRIKYAESNGNLYFTTSSGIKKVAALTASDLTTAANYITNAGGIKATGLEGKIKPINSGWLPSQSKVAYRLTWNTRDINSNVIQGTPSSRLVVTNTSQDINVGETFKVTVLAYASITDSEYFVFDTPTNKIFVWFDVSGTATQPATAETVGRFPVKVNINSLTTNNEVAAAIANALLAVTDIEVEIATNEITITNRDSGDVLDASQGSVAASDVLISKVTDGQTASGTPANVELSFTIPEGITTDYYYEIYRTGISTVSVGVTLNDIDPGDECQKVYEAPILAADLVSGSITFEDITPDTFREGGAFLYTNPVSGRGILSANEAPPIATDIALFKGSTFYSNTKERHKKQFNLLSVTDFISGSSKLYIGNSQTTREYTFVGVPEITDITVKIKSQTLGNSYIILNSAQDERVYKVWIDKGLITHNFDAIGDVNNALDTITVPFHGFGELEQIKFSGTVPTGLTAGVTYYAYNVTGSTFQVSATNIAPSAINITGVVGTCTVTHTPQEPVVANTLSLRVALETYPNTLQGSKDALIDAFFDVLDFIPTDFSASVVRIQVDNNGNTSNPTQSTPATGWTVSVFQEGDGEDAVANEVLLSGLASVGQSVEETARSLERVINKDPDSPVNAYYLSGPTDLPGILLLEARDIVDDQFFVSVSDSSLSSKFNPEAPVAAIITSITITGNLFTTSTPHGFFVGQEVYINDNIGTPTLISGKYKIATTPAVNTFTLVGLVIDTNQSPITGIACATTVSSDNAVNPNRIYYSKTFQPESVPLVNFIDIGPKDFPIERILPLRDSLIILKTDGVYVLTGSETAGFSVRLSDSSAIIVAPDSAVVLNNLVYALTTQGVVSVSETGVSIISRNIENKIQEVVNSKFNYKYNIFSVASESDRAFIMFMPTRTIDTNATQAYRYNTFTRAWTRWTKPATCGVINPAVDKIYLGSGEASRPYVLQERKNLERQDYADRDFELSFPSSAFSDTTYTISSTAQVEAGDVIVQEQYLDVPKFNRFLKKLDRDQLISNDYFSTLQATIGDNLAQKLIALTNKLDTDLNPFVMPIPSGINTATNIRDGFNALVNALNSPSSGTAFKNYKRVTELLVYETLILAVDRRNNTITSNLITWFLEGSFRLYKAIKCDVEYAPQHFGKPEATKQINQGTFIFDQNNFWGGIVGYSSDRSADFVLYPFSEKGPGYWGGFSWANAIYGGGGNEVPVRTLVPQNKQRCRYLHVKFQHINAREKWRLLGVSLEPREVSPRGYR